MKIKSKFKIIMGTFFFSFFLFPLTYSFAGSTVNIHGKVKSYNEGVYQIQTDQSLVNIECSKLLQAYNQQLRTTGNRVSITVPTSAILSYRERINNPHRRVIRAPASIGQKIEIVRFGIGR